MWSGCLCRRPTPGAREHDPGASHPVSVLAQQSDAAGLESQSDCRVGAGSDASSDRMRQVDHSALSADQSERGEAPACRVVRLEGWDHAEGEPVHFGAESMPSPPPRILVSHRWSPTGQLVSLMILWADRGPRARGLECATALGFYRSRVVACLSNLTPRNCKQATLLMPLLTFYVFDFRFST